DCAPAEHDRQFGQDPRAVQRRNRRRGSTSGARRSEGHVLSVGQTADGEHVMKLIDPKPDASIAYAGMLEKIEIMRSSLRWAQQLDLKQIQRLLQQCTSLREELLKSSHTERFVRATATRGKQTVAARRKALLDREFQFDGVFGDSPKLIEALEIAERAPPRDLPVLIDGESGTGKELMAKDIHANGSRAQKPYITVNCGAIPGQLVESILSG